MDLDREIAAALARVVASIEARIAAERAVQRKNPRRSIAAQFRRDRLNGGKKWRHST